MGRSSSERNSIVEKNLIDRKQFRCLAQFGSSFVGTNFKTMFAVVIIGAAFALGMLVQKSLVREEGEPQTADAELEQTFKEFLKLKNDCLGNCAQRTKALKGDLESARAMALIANKLNPHLREYWYQIGAENGDPISQYNLADLLSESRNTEDSVRALFWLNKVRESGDTDTERLTQELEAIGKN